MSTDKKESGYDGYVETHLGKIVKYLTKLGIPIEYQTRILGIFKSKNKGNKKTIQYENNEYQPTLSIIVDETTKMSDGSTIKECHFDPEVVNIKNAINYIVNVYGKKNFGEITVYNSKHKFIEKFLYNKGTDTSQFSNLPKNTRVKLIESHGGLEYMGYKLVVVK